MIVTIDFAFAFIRPNGNTTRNKHIVPTLTEMKPYIDELLDYTSKIKPKPLLEGVPLCFMKGHEDQSAETWRLTEFLPVNYGSEGEKRHYDLHSHIFYKLKRKSKSCANCSKNDICAGVWQEYADIHGTNELKPY